MPEWNNPYGDLQHALRRTLKDRLRRTNGRVRRDQLLQCADPARIERAEKLILRLCRVLEGGELEWKSEIVDEADLVRKLSGSSAMNAREVVVLWQRSRSLTERTAYPYLAPAANKGQLVSRHSFVAAPVFGVDLLVRPITEFSNEAANGTRNSLVLGDECFALVAHGDFSGGRLSDHGDYFVRLVVGDDLAIPVITDRVAPTARRCELAMIAPLYAGDAEAAVDAVLPHLHEFARGAAMAAYT